MAVRPRPQYAPLFAYGLWRQHQFAGAVGSSWDKRTPPTTILPSGMAILSIEDWLRRFREVAA